MRPKQQEGEGRRPQEPPNVEWDPMPMPEKLWRPVPIVGTTQAGPPDRVWEELQYPPGFGDGWIEAYTKDPNAYGLRVVGDSMAPRLVEGEYLLVSPNTKPTTGEEVIIRSAEGACMVKILTHLDDREAILSSVNDQYDRFAIPIGNIDILHAVVAIYRRSSVRYA